MNKYDLYQKAIESAKAELEQAEQNLELVDEELQMWAIAEVLAKREKLNALIKLAKKECA